MIADEAEVDRMEEEELERDEEHAEAEEEEEEDGVGGNGKAKGNGKLPPPEAMDEALMNELLLVCSNLGMKEFVTDEDGETREVFIRGDSCIEWVRDLQRAIRRDDARNRHVFITLGSWRVFQNKLLPLFVNHQDDEKLTFAIMKIFVMLTMKGEKTSHQVDKQNEYLAEYKVAMCNPMVIGVMLIMIESAMMKKDRDEMDNLKLELFLMLIRNVLCIPDPVRTSNELSVEHTHDQFLLMLQETGVMDIIISLAEDRKDAREWSLLFVEIIHAIVRGHQPSDLFKPRSRGHPAPSKANASGGESTIPSANSTSRQLSTSDIMLKQLAFEKESRKKVLQNTSGRHSQFGFAVSFEKMNGRKVILTSSGADPLKHAPQAPRRNVKALTPVVGVHDSKLSTSSGPRAVDSPFYAKIRDIVIKTTESFISNCYSSVMLAAQSDIQRSSAERILPTDKLIYFELAQYCICFWRYKSRTRSSDTRPDSGTQSEYEVGPLILNLNEWSWNQAYSHAETCIESKNYKDLVYPTKVLKEMLLLLWEMISSKNDAMRKAARANLHMNIFQLQERLDFYGRLLKSWHIGQFEWKLLADMVELIHTLLKVADLESGKVEVSARRRRAMEKKQKKKAKKPKQPNESSEGGEEQKEEEESDESDFESDNEGKEKATEEDRRKFLFDFNGLLRSLISNNVVRMYISLLTSYYTNPPKTNHYVISFLSRVKKHKICEVPEGLTLAPMLYKIEFLSLYDTILNDVRISKKTEFSPVLSFVRAIVYDFATLAEKNHLLFVESLMPYQHPRRACERILLVYDNPALAEKNDEIAESDDEPAKSSAPEPRAKESRQQPEPEESDGENEFNGTSAFPAMTEETQGKRRPRKKGTGTKKWTPEEDEFLRKEYEGLKDLPSVLEILALEDIFQTRNRTPEQIGRRVTHLGLRRVRAAYPVEDDTKSKVKKYVTNLKDSSKEKYQLAMDFVKAFLRKVLEDWIEGEDLKKDVKLESDNQRVIKGLETPKLEKLMSAMNLKKPAGSRKQWAIPKDMSWEEVEARYLLLEPYAPQIVRKVAERDSESEPDEEDKDGDHSGNQELATREPSTNKNTGGAKRRLKRVAQLVDSEDESDLESSAMNTNEQPTGDYQAVEVRRTWPSRFARLIASDEEDSDEPEERPPVREAENASPSTANTSRSKKIARLLESDDEADESPEVLDPAMPLPDRSDASGIKRSIASLEVDIEQPDALSPVKRPRRTLIIEESDEEED